MIRKNTQPYFIYSPIGRTGSTILKAWIDSSPDVGPNANEYCYLPGYICNILSQSADTPSEGDYFARREPIYDFIRRGIGAYQFSLNHHYGLKIHAFRALTILKQAFPEAKIIYSVRKRSHQFRSKTEQQDHMDGTYSPVDQFARDMMVEYQEIEQLERLHASMGLTGSPYLRVNYAKIPEAMSQVFEYLELTPGDFTPQQARNAYFARSHSSRTPSFNEAGWLSPPQ